MIGERNAALIFDVMAFFTWMIIMIIIEDKL
jgi:hypothetical protein